MHVWANGQNGQNEAGRPPGSFISLFLPQYQGSCRCCGLCAVTCSGTTTKSELDEMTEKNKELELELKRLRKDVFYHSTDTAAENPEIAQLLVKNEVL